MKDYIWVLIAYVCALISAIISFQLFKDQPVLIQLLISDVVATVVIFIFSVVFKNSSFYDPYWSLAPIALALAFLLISTEAVFNRQILVCLFTFLWGVRLTWNWLYGWQGLNHQDWRYVRLKETTGIFYWLVSFLGIHLFPTLIVFLGCLAMYPALSMGNQPINWIDALAGLVSGAAIWIETQADIELHRFRAHRDNKAEFLTSGVWRWCRHPNYLGEVGFWIGLFLFGYAAQGNTGSYIASGPVAMILLFVFISIPMIDKKLLEEKPGYQSYKERTYALLPFSMFKQNLR